MLSRRLCPAGRYAPADAPADGRIRARRWYWWMEPGCRNGVACEMLSLLDPRPAAVAAEPDFIRFAVSTQSCASGPGKHGLGVLPALGGAWSTAAIARREGLARRRRFAVALRGRRDQVSESDRSLHAVQGRWQSEPLPRPHRLSAPRGRCTIPGSGPRARRGHGL